MLMSKDRVYSSLPNPAFRIPGYMRKVTASSGAGSARAARSDSLWKVQGTSTVTACTSLYYYVIQL